MTQSTNPRKIGDTGKMVYVNIPEAFLEASCLEKGDRVILELTDDGFSAHKVQIRKVTND